MKKKKRKFKPPREEKRVVYPTDNAKKIAQLMKANGVKGKYKDHVVIIGGRMLDWLGSYDMIVETEDGEQRYGVEGMSIIHKRNLAPIIGKSMANQFWQCGIRTNYGVEARRAGCR